MAFPYCTEVKVCIYFCRLLGAVLLKELPPPKSRLDNEKAREQEPLHGGGSVWQLIMMRMIPGVLNGISFGRNAQDILVVVVVVLLF